MHPKYAKDPLADRSLRHAVREGVAFSVMVGAGETTFSAFALHLKASTSQVGLLATLPLLLGSFAQLLSVLLGRRLARRRTLILAGAGLQVLAWLPLALTPLLFPDKALEALLLSMVFYFASGQLITPQWASLMGDLVPEQRRGRYFAYRTRVASLTHFAAMLAAGALLNRFDSAGYATAGFIAVFGLAAAARAVSLWELAQMHEPHPAALPPAPPHGALREFAGSRFGRFALFNALMQASVGVAGPFFTVYMLRDLQLGYLGYMTLLAVAVLFQVLTLGPWGRIADAFGNRLVLIGTGFMIPALPALWLFSDHFGYLLLLQALSGLVWGGFTLASGNFCYDLIPAPLRAAWMASYNLSANLGLFCGALAGGWLAHSLPQRIAVGDWVVAVPSSLLLLFLISALLRLGVACLFLPRLAEARVVRRPELRRLAFRATRMRWTLTGMRPPRTRRRPATRTLPTGSPAQA